MLSFGKLHQYVPAFMNLRIFTVLRGRRGKLFDIFVPPSLQRGCSGVTTNNLIFAQQPQKSFETSSADLLYIWCSTKLPFKSMCHQSSRLFLQSKNATRSLAGMEKLTSPPDLEKVGLGIRQVRGQKTLVMGWHCQPWSFCASRIFLRVTQMVWTVAGFFRHS